MRTIWKYPIPNVGNPFDLEMPAGAKDLRFELRLGRPYLWALLETDAPPERRTFLCVRTLDPLPPGEFRVIGSAVPSTGGNVVHLIELLSQPDGDAAALPVALPQPRHPDGAVGLVPVDSGRLWHEVELDVRAVLGHDAHNILTAIVGYDELAREDPAGEGAVGDRRNSPGPKRSWRTWSARPFRPGRSTTRRHRSCWAMTSTRQGSSPSAWPGPPGRARHDPPHRRRRSPGRRVRTRR